MRATFTRMQKINPELIPPANAVAFGITPSGKQLYRLVTPRTKAVPDVDPETGEQRWRKNQMTGEPLYPLNKPESYEQVRTFYLESQGNGNVQLVDWSPPSEEQLARAQKALRAAEMREALLEALVESGIEPSALVANLKAKPTPNESPASPVDPTAMGSTQTGPREPQMFAPGRWRLSNGEVVKGTRTDAIGAEEAVQAAVKVLPKE